MVGFDREQLVWLIGRKCQDAFVCGRSYTFASHERPMWRETFGAVALTWYATVWLVIAIGTVQLIRYFTTAVAKPVSPELPPAAVPHVTVIRPVKGPEPCLYDCLAATFRQNYPQSKLTVFFCVASRDDPAFPTLERLIADHTTFDAKIYVEEEDERLSGRDGERYSLGPNPKIRNMSKAYADAKGDLVWIIDCNVWVSPSACGLMVDSLCGLSPLTGFRKYKFVHQLPLAVDITSMSTATMPSASASAKWPTRATAGGLLDEMFLSTSHAKFYTAISTVAIAPCIVGKSNMFRRSHLAALTTQPRRPSSNNNPEEASPPHHHHPGVDFFSHNICEDHLIGDLLWKSAVPPSVLASAALEGKDHQSAQQAPPVVAGGSSSSSRWGNHAIVPSPPCIQPLAEIPLSSYLARRTRWLRVRKFTVPLATLVEPGTESLLANALGAYGLTTVQWAREGLGIPQTWGAFGALWVVGVAAWCALDWHLWRMLQRWRSEGLDSAAVDEDVQVPVFVGSGVRRTFGEWFVSWCGRELLAWPVWAWAVLGGTEVVWRGRRFWVGFDMRVHEIQESKLHINKVRKGA